MGESILEKGDVDISTFSRSASIERQNRLRKEIEHARAIRENQEREKNNVIEDMKSIERAKIRNEGIMSDWIEKKHSFHNAKIRAEIRLREGRPEALDIIFKNLLLSNEFGMDPDPPHLTFSRLTLRKMEHLAYNINIFSQILDSHNTFQYEYWQQTLIVLDHEINIAKKAIKPEIDHSLETNHDTQIEESIKTVLHGKNFKELVNLEIEIKNHLNSDSAPDLDFWEKTLKRLKVHQALKRLKEMHDELYRDFLKNNHTKKEDSEYSTYNISSGQSHLTSMTYLGKNIGLTEKESNLKSIVWNDPTSPE